MNGKSLPDKEKTTTPVRPGKIMIGAMYFFFAAVVLRTFANPNIQQHLPIYLALQTIYIVLSTLMLWRPLRKRLWQHLYLIFQSTLVLTLTLLRPRFDFIAILYVILCLQAVLLFTGRARWIWLAILILLIGVPMTVTLGVLIGLSLALMPMTLAIILASYVSVTQEIETGLHNRQVLLDELHAANRQLTVSANQVEELSAIQERNRLARELHDSVSQTMFSISLHTRAAQIILERDPDRLRSQLEQLQALTHSALQEMRGLIAQLHPQESESARRTKT
jgi:signal transduction histidine kinase